MNDISNKRIFTSTNKKMGRLYAGPDLPRGAKIIGTITRNYFDTGALLLFEDGRLYQYNNGCLRTLPKLTATRSNEKG